MAEKSTVEVLREARELISDPKRWTQGWLARDASGDDRGRSLHATHPDAAAWCGSGAVCKAAGVPTLAKPNDTLPAYRALCAATERYDFAGFNDTRSHAEVLAAFDKAIELAEAEKVRLHSVPPAIPFRTAAEQLSVDVTERLDSIGERLDHLAFQRDMALAAFQLAWDEKTALALENQALREKLGEGE